MILPFLVHMPAMLHNCLHNIMNLWAIGKHIFWCDCKILQAKYANYITWTVALQFLGVNTSVWYVTEGEGEYST